MEDWERHEGSRLDAETFWVDRRGHKRYEPGLVTTQRWIWFQKAIKRFHNQLGLCFDRKLERWSLYRKDIEIRPMFLGHDIEPHSLYQAAPVYTVVYAIQRWTEDENYIPSRHYMEPGDWVLRDLVRQHPAQFGVDSSEWIAKYTKIMGESEWDRAMRDADEIGAACMSDYKSACSKTNPTWDKTHHTVPELPAAMSA